MERTFQFRPLVARRIPDPNFKKSHNAERHVLVMPVRSLPMGLPLDPNARRPNIRKRVYQDVLRSLLNEEGEPGTFHLKNKGITVIAESVKQKGDNEYIVVLKKGIHGIVDGGHTYKLITDNLTSLPEEQFVQVEIRTGIPDTWVPEIAGGLNTSVQVQDMSLDNLSGNFEWLKKELRKEAYFKKIAWSENDPGDFDARDIIALLMVFNVSLFPNDRDEHPVAAYEKKSQALKAFEDKPKTFELMTPIVRDVLKLHDVVAKESREVWNKEVGGNAGNLAFMEGRKKGTWDFIFTGDASEYRLYSGALYPILGAFRWYVRTDPLTGTASWRDGFEEVRKAWRSIAPELLKATLQQSNELGRNPNAIGKSRNHWANLHTRVAKFDLMSRQRPG